MITEQDEKIIAKIKKLLNIANNDASSDGDIQASMNAVHNLMNRHHLTEEDLAHEPADDYKKTDDAEKGLYRSWLGGKMYSWESSLAVFVSTFVGVPCYADKQKLQAQDNGILKRDRATGKTWMGKSIVFYGVAEDAQIAKELYDDLRLLICTMAFAKFEQIYKLEGGKYCEGFVQGLDAQLKRENAQEKKLAQDTSSSTGLLVIERRDDLIKYKEKVATKWLKQKMGEKFKLRKGAQTSGASGDFEAWAQGVKDGKNTEVAATRNKKLN